MTAPQNKPKLIPGTSIEFGATVDFSIPPDPALPTTPNTLPPPDIEPPLPPGRIGTKIGELIIHREALSAPARVYSQLEDDTDKTRPGRKKYGSVPAEVKPVTRLEKKQDRKNAKRKAKANYIRNTHQFRLKQIWGEEIDEKGIEAENARRADMNSRTYETELDRGVRIALSGKHSPESRTLPDEELDKIKTGIKLPYKPIARDGSRYLETDFRTKIKGERIGRRERRKGMRAYRKFKRYDRKIARLDRKVERAAQGTDKPGKKVRSEIKHLRRKAAGELPRQRATRRLIREARPLPGYLRDDLRTARGHVSAVRRHVFEARAQRWADRQDRKDARKARKSS